jgi:hypothetical protein
LSGDGEHSTGDGSSIERGGVEGQDGAVVIEGPHSLSSNLAGGGTEPIDWQFSYKSAIKKKGRKKLVI